MARKDESMAKAARKLVDSAAARERKAAVARERKAATAAAGGKALSQRGSSAATSIPVGASYAGGFFPFPGSSAAATWNPRLSAATPSTGGRFPGAQMSTGSRPWMPPRQGISSLGSDPSNWDNNPIPDGGFMNYLNSQPLPSHENFHLVGETYTSAQTNRSPSLEEISTPPMTQTNITSADCDEPARTEKRIIWKPEEDKNLMSAWLKCSLDPIEGNDRRNDQYWNEVVEVYNLTVPSHRRRNRKQAKDRWHKINKLADLFHGAYLKARRLNQSGYNEELWIQEAHKFFEQENQDSKVGRFTLMDVWYLIRNEAKWQTYNDGLKKSANKRKNSEKGAEGSQEEDDFDIAEIPRPMGQKAAKKAAYESKKKVSNPSLVDDEDVQILKQAQANRLKFLEVQQQLSAERLESSRLSHQAARDQVKAKMMDTYNILLAKDEEKAEHVAMLKHLKTTLFPGVL